MVRSRRGRPRHDPGSSATEEERLITPGHLDPRVERSRVAILDTAVELLLGGGMSALTVDAVSERSGVAKTTIYRHWESRNALVIDAFRSCLPSIDTPDAGLGFEDALLSMMTDMTLAIGEPRFRAALPHILAAKQEIEGMDEIKDRIDQDQFTSIKNVLERGITEGRLPPDTDLTEAKHQLIGHLVSMTLTPGSPMNESTAKRIVELFLASRNTSPHPESLAP